MADGGINVGSLSSLKSAVSTLEGQLEAVLATAGNVATAGDNVVAALGTSTTNATKFSAQAQALHTDEFESAKTSLSNYIEFLNNSYTALDEAEKAMSSGTTTYATTGGN